MTWQVDSEPCRLCGGVLEIDREDERTDARRCRTCGIYEVDPGSVEFLKKCDDSSKALLSGLAREYQDRGRRLKISENGFADLLKQAPDSVPEKLNRFLLALARRSSFPGQAIELDGLKDLPLAYAGKEPQVLKFFFKELKARGLLSRFDWDAGQRPVCVLSAEAWRVVGESREKRAIRSDFAFVAMSSAPEHRSIYLEGIAPGVGDAGWRPIRVDQDQNGGRIDDVVISQIRDARFIVADFTEHRGGVYFESGLALGLGLPVIWTCRQDHLAKLHFDPRQFNHLVYDAPADLRKKLSSRIRAFIGRGPRLPDDPSESKPAF